MVLNRIPATTLTDVTLDQQSFFNTIYSDAGETWVFVVGKLLKSAEFQQLFDEFDEASQLGWANRAFNEAIRLLRLFALRTGCQLRPSKKVDAAWHTFILCTPEYFHFCRHVAGPGRFIHHNRRPQPAGKARTPGETLPAFDTHGLGPADRELWTGASTECCKDEGDCDPDDSGLRVLWTSNSSECTDGPDDCCGDV